MNRRWSLVLLPFIFLLFNSCAMVVKTFSDSSTIDYESSSELGQIHSYIEILKREYYFFPHNYFQSVLPYLYENYAIEVSVSNWNYLNNEEDIMRNMYIDECRIALPSGKIIDLLERNITIIYRYYASKEVTGIPSKELQNVQPQDINGKKVVYIDGLADGDSVKIIFNARIPSYSTDSLRLEYANTVLWENTGEVKQRMNILFKKESHKFNPFTV